MKYKFLQKKFSETLWLYNIDYKIDTTNCISNKK